MYFIPFAMQCPACLYAAQQSAGRYAGNLVQPGTDAGTAASPLHTAGQSQDRGQQPFVFNIREATEMNPNYRTAVWTGEHLQVTLMSIGAGEDIGLEIHPEDDQFLRIEEGRGLVQMGNSAARLTYEKEAGPGSAILIPAGTWHNVKNIGEGPLKLYSIYAPPNHPFGTIHRTKAEAEQAEKG